MQGIAYTVEDHPELPRDLLPPRMYLHAHRLLLPTGLEHLDLSAGDPFTEEECPQWREEGEVTSLQQAYADIHDQALSWKMVSCDAVT